MDGLVVTTVIGGSIVTVAHNHPSIHLHGQEQVLKQIYMRNMSKTQIHNSIKKCYCRTGNFRGHVIFAVFAVGVQSAKINYRDSI